MECRWAYLSCGRTTEFLAQTEKNGILLVKWIPGPTNDADLHTKNLAALYFKKHVTFTRVRVSTRV